uniref:Rhodanese domain-containing protein n=1 Tax=Cyanoderma ruficeps TaxID=181631 RepID=A0A8C3NPQ2_9PASS
MAGVMFCEPRQLYNIINQYRWRSRLTEPNYLCLLDARSQREFNESHIVTAQRIVLVRGLLKAAPPVTDLQQQVKNKSSFQQSFLQSVRWNEKGFAEDVREADGHTEPAQANSSLVSLGAGEGDALLHARNLEHFTRHPVLLLKGGYRRFSACYHFLKSQKTLWMPQELDTFQPYPVEILPAKLYMGNFKQASDKQIQKDLKIKALVNVSEQPVTLFAEEGKSLHISVPDSLEADLFSSFPTISHFIGEIIFCSIPNISFLSSCLQRAWKYLLKCKMNMRPNRGFVKQLSAWETQIYGWPITDISEPKY